MSKPESLQPESLQRRSGLRIMGSLIGLVAPLLPVMVGAILLGTVGHLCAIFLTILAGYVFAHWIFELFGGSLAGTEGGGQWAGLGDWFSAHPTEWLWILLVVAVLRGVLHYGEQYCNHFIAFKLLAIVRHKVFAKLRQLAPAKLETKNKGDLLAVLTQDIELLEVFYAHTISPIAIAILTCGTMIAFISQFSVVAALFAAIAYLTVGVIIPLSFGRSGAQAGLAYRNQVGELNEFLLESLWGVEEVLQYNYGSERARQLDQQSRNLSQPTKTLNTVEAKQRAVTNLAVLGFSLVMAFWQIWQYQQGNASLLGLILAVIALMGSFGPVIALSNLSNSLHQTLACGERVLNVLDESAETAAVSGKEPIELAGQEIAGQLDQVNFTYLRMRSGSGNEFAGTGGTSGVESEASQATSPVLDHLSLTVKSGRILGMYGPSGCGKSTVLKLLMRFWDPQSGTVKVFERDAKGVNTSDLRELEGYVTQETELFQDTIANNIAIGKIGATQSEIAEAARKASLADFIESLPQGYETVIGKNGVTLSGGETQRVGIARAFLHDAPLLLLDEPTSNLDSLNEGIILKSLHESRGDKTIVLVSHRRSTLGSADVQIDFAQANGHVRK